VPPLVTKDAIFAQQKCHLVENTKTGVFKDSYSTLDWAVAQKRGNGAWS
jgi:hypothetical protein